MGRSCCLFPSLHCPLPTPPPFQKRKRKALEDDLHARERVLEGLGRDLSRGLNSVKRLTYELQLEGKVGAVPAC